jgi:YegS/Rv2252/BmrU family lipid kinase
MTRRALLVVNPLARGLPPLRQIQEAADWLRTRGWDVALETTAAPGEATRLARRAASRGRSVVVACGGDGTIHEVVNGLAGSEAVLAVIPGGTANVWAKDARLPRRPLEAARIIEDGRCRRIDLGLIEWEAPRRAPPDGAPLRASASGPVWARSGHRAERRYFLLMVGIGLDAHVVARVSQGWKRRLGAAAYVLTAAREALFYRSQPVELELDGRERLSLRLGWMLAGNTRCYGGVTHIASRALADDGLLELLIFPGYNLLRATGYGLVTLAGRHYGAPGVTYRQAAEIEVAGPSSLPIQADGEFVGYTPLRLRVVPGALQVLVPDEPNPLFGAT